MDNKEEKKSKRQEILDRLNFYAESGDQDRQNKERSKKNKAEREKALAKGRRGQGWIGM